MKFLELIAIYSAIEHHLLAIICEPIDLSDIKIQELKEYCLEHGIETIGDRRERKTFVIAIDEYLSKKMVPVSEIADRPLVSDDFLQVAILCLKFIMVLGLVSYKVGWKLGEIIDKRIYPTIKQWHNDRVIAQWFATVADRIQTYKPIDIQ